MTDSRLDFLDAMWAKFSPIARERVADLERYVRDSESGEPTEAVRAAAEWSAHKLVGALGSFRRAGSAEAAIAERLLQERAPGADLDRVVRMLRGVVDASPVEQEHPRGDEPPTPSP